MTGGGAEGAEENATRVRYRPGPGTGERRYSWDIGTAGSAVMLALSVLPLAAFASGPTRFTVTGGLFQDFAPSAWHMRRVLLPLLERMGLGVSLKVVRPGYVPKGGGRIEVEVRPVSKHLAPLELPEQGRLLSVEGESLASHLDRQQVAPRMAEACGEILRAKGLETIIDVVEDDAALQKGAALCVAALSDRGCRIGADRAGAVGRSSETIGRHVARSLLEDLASGATVDRFLADQLILFAGLAAGTSTYVVPRMTAHVETNLWLIETFLGATAEWEGRLLKIHGSGHDQKLSA
jgi:RNA 3'-terminal phosphate cyclase (ATP)